MNAASPPRSSGPTHAHHNLQHHHYARHVTSHPHPTTASISAPSPRLSSQGSPRLAWHSPPPPPPPPSSSVRPSSRQPRHFSPRNDSVWSQTHRLPREGSRPIDVHRMLKGMAIEGLYYQENTTAVSDDPLEPSKSSTYRLHGERHLEQRTLDSSAQAYDRDLLSKIGRPARSRSSVSSFTSTNPAASPRLLMSSPELGQSPVHRSAHQRTSSMDSATTRETAGKALAASNIQHHLASSASPPAFRFRSHTPDTGRTARHQSAKDHDGRIDPKRGLAERRTASPTRSRSSPHSVHSSPKFMHAGTKRRASPSDHIDDRAPKHSSSIERSSLHNTYHSPSAITNGQPCPAESTPQYSNHLTHDALASRLSAVGSYPQDIKIENDRTSSQRPSVEAPPWRSMHSTPHPGSVHTLGTFVCDCCPKKPRRFANEEDLKLHHLEKQYTCAYCPNRFKNKNEAERHQNSLHLRKHSWSCSSLLNREDVFHPSQANAGARDVCGFCGDEFENPPNWQQRYQHIDIKHKFGDCNQGKKFFRADHFRQHLKHSHAGTSGKWTNMLENACMKDEPEPVPMDRRQPDQSSMQTQNLPTLHHETLHQQQPSEHVEGPLSVSQSAQQIMQQQSHQHTPNQELQLPAPPSHAADDFVSDALILDPRMTAASYEQQR